MTQDKELEVATLHTLFCAGDRAGIEALAGPNPKGVAASMLSAMYLREGTLDKAADLIPGIESADERTLKSKTLELYQALHAPLEHEPRVHVLMLTCNSLDFVDGTLKQLAATAYSNYAISIMDNGSTDGTWDIAQKARDYFPEHVGVTVTWLPFNAGRPVGHNLMLTQHDHSLAEFVAIVDDDLIQVSPNWLRDMVATFACFPQAAVVGGKALSPGEKKVIHGGVRRLSRFTEDTLETTNNGECTDTGQFDFVDKVDHVCGCLNLYHAEPLFSSIGLFDTRYSPCQYVDLDHHLSTRLLGYDVIYNGLVECVHARTMSHAAAHDRALLGNAQGNMTKLLHKFTVAEMEALMATTARQRQEWLASTR